MSDGLLRIYLARHGQTDWNAAHRLQGWTDIDLNETGRAQARDLARRVPVASLERIYCSALRRSRETAEIVAAGRTPVEPLPSLNERRMGSFEGAFVDGRDPAVVAEYLRRSSDPEDSLDTGESKRAHHARVQGAIHEILGRHARGSILVVGHGGTNAAILATLLPHDALRVSLVRQANDEIFVVEFEAHRPPRLFPLARP